MKTFKALQYQGHYLLRSPPPFNSGSFWCNLLTKIRNCRQNKNNILYMQKYFKHICIGVLHFPEASCLLSPLVPQWGSSWSLPKEVTTVWVQGLVVKFEWRMTMFSWQSFSFLPNYGVIKQTIAPCHGFFKPTDLGSTWPTDYTLRPCLNPQIFQDSH